MTAEIRPNRWWIYQRERFPIAAHGPLILAFSLSAVCFSSLLRGNHELPALSSMFVAFVSSFISFLHLRLADEFKDFEEDSKYRPYRAVPRGLVKLRELGVLWAGTGAVQFGLAVWLDSRLLLPLAVTWIYLALMSREFFCRKWLKTHPVTYMWTHMLIMPLIDFYATACDWLPAGGLDAPPGLGWFVAASFFNGFVIEIGRKIRAPGDEEHGVETYSALWGRPRAFAVWLLVMVLTAASAGFAAVQFSFALPVGVALGSVFVASIFSGIAFLRAPLPSAGKRFELFSGIWTLTLYLTLGAAPKIVAMLHS